MNKSLEIIKKALYYYTDFASEEMIKDVNKAVELIGKNLENYETLKKLVKEFVGE